VEGAARCPGAQSDGMHRQKSRGPGAAGVRVLGGELLARAGWVVRPDGAGEGQPLADGTGLGGRCSESLQLLGSWRGTSKGAMGGDTVLVIRKVVSAAVAFKFPQVPDAARQAIHARWPENATPEVRNEEAPPRHSE